MIETLSPHLMSAEAGMRAWLACGAVQAPSGAFHAWCDEAGRPSFEYPEITGYALTHFAGLVYPDDHEVTAGHRAGTWLVNRLRSGDLSARESWDGHTVYTFDLAMIATGLMAFGSRHSSEEMIASGLALAGDIQEEIASTGSLQSVPPRSGSVSSRSAWSTEGLAHLIKTVQCLLWAGELGQDGCVDAAAQLVREACRAQCDDGRFRTHPDDRETMLHPHLYAVEGLWMWGAATGDAEALRRARLATQWVWTHQRFNGAFPRWISASGEEGPNQADLTAQALRAAVLVDVAADRRATTAEWLAGAAVWNRARTAAAVPYQPGSGTVHLNTWTTLFAAQALMSHLVGPDAVSWRSLV